MTLRRLIEKKFFSLQIIALDFCETKNQKAFLDLQIILFYFEFLMNFSFATIK